MPHIDDMRPDEGILDMLTNNFEVKTLKARKENIKKLSGSIPRPLVNHVSSSFSSSSSSSSSSASVNGKPVDFHSASQSSSAAMIDNNGKINAAKVDAASHLDSDPKDPTQVLGAQKFQFEKINPEGDVVLGNMQHPVYMTPFGSFKPMPNF